MKLIRQFGSTVIVTTILAVVIVGLTAYGMASNASSKTALTTVVTPVKTTAKAAAPTTTPTATTPTTTTPVTTTKPTTQTKTTTPVAVPKVVTLTASDKAEAVVNLGSIQSNLESYFALNDYYPGTIAPAEFASSDITTSNGDGTTTDPVTAMKQYTTTPTGVTYVYVPTAGCTTAAHNCLHYTLTAKGPDSAVLGSKQDFNQ